MSLFPGFESHRVRTSGAEINCVKAGQGEPLLLLHGYPQTHACWHQIAPALARRYTVVCADLRGYGDSSKPAGLADHSNYSKRAMALDMVELMAALGLPRFHLVGHDRGGRVAHRLAADHAEQVQTLAVLDISPTLKVFERTDMALAKAYYHWFLMLQPAPLAEKMMAAVAPFHILAGSGLSGKGLKAFSKAALAEYVRTFADPRTIHATCEDYRASGGIDLEHDRADRRNKLAMPVQVLWGRRGVVGTQFDCLATWRKVARNVTGQAIDCGHFIPEEAPVETLAAIREFLARHDTAHEKAMADSGKVHVATK